MVESTKISEAPKTTEEEVKNMHNGGEEEATNEGEA